MKQFVTIHNLIFISVLLLTACKKQNAPNSTNEQQIQPVIISNISPASGPRTTIVEIFGSNFGTNISSISVKFNGLTAVLNSITDTKIIAVVPNNAGDGPVTIEKNGTTITGPFFQYTWLINVTSHAGSSQGFADGGSTNAKFSEPSGIAIDANGNIYVADRLNNRIRKITAAGVVSTLAGSSPGFADGSGTNAKFNDPRGVAIDANGNVYVADRLNNRIRKITAAGVVSTLAGSTEGFADGSGTNAKFDKPAGVAIDANGNIYVADFYNHRIRKITAAGIVSTLAGSSKGFTDGSGTNAKFHNPVGVAADANGNVHVADYGNNRIRKITAVGAVSTLAGSSGGFADGSFTNARFDDPTGVAIDVNGNVYVADADNHRIRKITIE